MTPTFKALTPAGEWVEGHYNSMVHHFKRYNIIYTEHNGQHEVLPETVCMATGLTDKNWNMIYEGDELEIDGMKMFVDWFDGGFHLGRNENQTRSHASQDRTRKFTLTGKNIHDKTESK